MPRASVNYRYKKIGSSNWITTSGGFSTDGKTESSVLKALRNVHSNSEFEITKIEWDEPISQPNQIVNQQNTMASSSTLQQKNTTEEKSNKNTTPSSNFTPSVGGAIDGLVGAAVVGGATIIGFGLKGIWKIITFPIWLMWMFFKGIFYTFPRFLWQKGKIGRICFCLYWLLWIVMMWMQHIGSEVIGGYIVSNWAYFIFMAIPILVCPILSIILRQKTRYFKRNITITIASGLLVIGTVFAIGFFGTKDLTVIPEKNTYAYINASELNIRGGPSSEDEVLTVLKEDTKVQILHNEENEDWVRIKYNDIEGYINKKYLREKRYVPK